MKIRNLNVINKSVRIEKISIDITKFGIYKISGPVGCGKTSLVEEILFGDNDILFENEVYGEIYRKNRYKLFAYVPQNLTQLDMSVKDFILRGNTCINDEKIISYLNKFSLDTDILNVNYSELSGGESTKIAIISELLKDTPYLFLDEPSNHLDDLSVEKLINILNEIKHNKVIVLISHDERLNVEITGNFVIENNSIHYIPMKKTYNEESKKHSVAKSENIKINYLRIINSVTRNMAHYISVLFLIMILIFLAVYSHFEFKKNYNTEKLPTSDILYVLSNGYYDELNERYAKAENIEIDEEKKEVQLMLDDVKSVSNIEGIADIYIKDVKYIDELYRKLFSEAQSEMVLFSCPEVIFEEFWNLTAIDLGFTYVYGRLPFDGKNEVVISMDLLNSYYDFKLLKEEDAIGEIITIEIDGESREYEVVGVSNSNIAILSYDPNSNMGYYKFNKDTFDTFYQEQNNYYIEQDAGEAVVDEMLIVTKKSNEQAVLNQLIERYPANNYYSNCYVKVWQKSYNNDRFFQVLIPNIICSGIFMIIIVLVNRSALKYNYSLIRSYENYYIDRKRIRRIYRFFTFYQYALCFVFSLIINTVLSEFYYIGNIYICINFVIVIIPLMISHFLLARIESR